ncbi:MAG: hypothetical protein DWP97_04515 [Calditrichaeota bacterium]|nr:MAG: hypothetical protein DWP97_04515 [Calditrichota bacterium]
MGYCPICKFEYDTKSSFCPDCQTMLVNLKDEANKAAVKPDNSWVVIAGVDDDINRELVKSSLDSRNIPSMFVNSGDNKETKQLSSLINITLEQTEQEMIIVPKEYQREAISVLKGLYEIGLELVDKNRENLT